MKRTYAHYAVQRELNVEILKTRLGFARGGVEVAELEWHGHRTLEVGVASIRLNLLPANLIVALKECLVGGLPC